MRKIDLKIYVLQRFKCSSTAIIRGVKIKVLYHLNLPVQASIELELTTSLNTVVTLIEHCCLADFGMSLKTLFFESTLTMVTLTNCNALKKTPNFVSPPAFHL